MTRTWSGSWVAEALDVALVTEHSPLGLDLTDLLGLAVRRNPRRAHLLVSRVLGKHVPTDPRLVYGAGLLLGELARRTLSREDVAPLLPLGGQLREALNSEGAAVGAAARTLPEAVGRVAGAGATSGVAPPTVLGFAETATALGHAVADALPGSAYLHSTRRHVAGMAAVGGFEEEHSHATSHLLLPRDPALLLGPGPLVLVDDELSTGRTALNTIEALHRLCPRERYVVAALVDLRSDADRAAMAEAAAFLGTGIEVVTLAAGRLELPEGILDRGAQLVETTEAAQLRPEALGPVGGSVRELKLRELKLPWPTGLPDGARHGVRAATAAYERAARAAAAALADALYGPDALDRPDALYRHCGGARPADRRVLVLGVEELMYVPLRIATELATLLEDAGAATVVAFSTTTRSPVLAVDSPGYAIRTRLCFPAHDDPSDMSSGDMSSSGQAPRFAYNVHGDSATELFDTVVVVVDAASDTPALRMAGGLLDQLTRAADEVVVAVLPDPSTVPPPRQPVGLPIGLAAGLPAGLHGPAFGSYDAGEVTWLLTDLSDVALEASTEEREEAIQSGGAHYAESLPVEYQPSPDYQQLFRAALATSAARVAHAVGVVTEMVLAARGSEAVLVSLARAGTPVGILMRRWARHRHGIDVPHYAVSIVRGRGIDRVALRYLAAHHDPAAVMFVDGWTGKGAITRELRAALADHARHTGDRFPGDLAVLADPGRCVELFGTREDYLIPSACLNSTVSGLVSRTVLNETLIGPRDFHGAKFYGELAEADVSAEFLDAVTACFDAVAGDVARDWPIMEATERTATWEGWAAVERLSADYGIGDVNLVKPGVGETTRVLLRRVPWKVLVREGAEAELAHVRLLAAQRGVPVETVTDLPYSCVGLIHPRFTRGAIGAQGTAAIGAQGTAAIGAQGTAAIGAQGTAAAGLRA